MSVKEVEIDGIGIVKLYKRRGSRGIRISLTSEGFVRVTMPPWFSYSGALAYVASKREWIVDHRIPVHVFINGEMIGKAHRVRFIANETQFNVFAKVQSNEIRVSYPKLHEIPSKNIQLHARRAALRALKKEAGNLLPLRVNQIARKHDLSYENVSVKHMKSRWGSCSHQKDISLNIFLMKLPWDLIDYVIIHELVHTKVLNHGTEFWELLTSCQPNAKEYRKSLQIHQPTF